MASFKNSRIFPIALVIIITIVAIAALISLARAVFFSGSNNSTTSQVDTSVESLLSTAIDRSVSMTVRGAIVADEEFRSYSITVTPSVRTLTTYNGYLEQQIDQITLPNNIPAYEEFVYALNRADMMEGTAFPDERNDTRGICATGRLYEFDVLKNGVSQKKLWTTTCSRSNGSLDADTDFLTRLFTEQIPDSRAVIRKVDLYS